MPEEEEEPRNSVTGELRKGYKKYCVSVSWYCYGSVEVDAKDYDEAMEKARDADLPDEYDVDNFEASDANVMEVSPEAALIDFMCRPRFTRSMSTMQNPITPLDYEKVAKERDEWRRKAENAMAANNALGASGRERDEVMTRIIRERDLAQGFAKMHENIYERCGVINRTLRESLRNLKNISEQLCAEDFKGGTSRWREFVDSLGNAADALNLSPSKAEKVVDAMEHVVDMAYADRDAGTDFYCDDLPAALATLSKVKDDIKNDR